MGTPYSDIYSLATLLRSSTFWIFPVEVFWRGIEEINDERRRKGTDRKFRNNDNPLWGSKPGQSLPGVNLQVGFKLFVLVFPLGGRGGVEGDESNWTFSPFGVPASHDSGLQNTGVGNQLLLNGEAGCILESTVKVRSGW